MERHRDRRTAQLGYLHRRLMPGRIYRTGREFLDGMARFGVFFAEYHIATTDLNDPT